MAPRATTYLLSVTSGESQGASEKNRRSEDKKISRLFLRGLAHTYREAPILLFF